jgi:hypothetical protein
MRSYAMTEQPLPSDADKDPEPVKESDAERASQADDKAKAIEDDPSSNPPEGELRDLKGG